MKIPRLHTGKIKEGLRKSFNELAAGGFETIFNQIDQLNIKKGVDRMGIHKFVNQCAFLAAGSGAITGIGGLTTMMIGVPIDVLNLITQQFRVTMAIAYQNTGTYRFPFEDFFKIVASSLKADTKLAISKNIMEEVAEKMLLNFGSKASQRLVPFVGAAIGGTVNYLFIKQVAKGLQETYH